MAILWDRSKYDLNIDTELIWLWMGIYFLGIGCAVKLQVCPDWGLSDGSASDGNDDDDWWIYIEFGLLELHVVGQIWESRFGSQTMRGLVTLQGHWRSRRRSRELQQDSQNGNPVTAETGDRGPQNFLLSSRNFIVAL